jgi:hypothetical protein
VTLPGRAGIAANIFQGPQPTMKGDRLSIP